MPQQLNMPRLIAEALRQRIAEGAIGENSLLPTQEALSREFGVSRHVVRKSLTRLREAGLIDSGQGARARPAHPSLRFPICRQTQFSRAVALEGREGRAELMSFSRRMPSRAIAQLLELPSIRPVKTAIVLRSVDGRPFSLSKHHFSPRIEERLPDTLSGPLSITRLLREVGYHDYWRERTVITSRLPTANEAVLLKIRRSQPVLATLGRNLSVKNEPLEVSESVFPAEHVEFHVQHEDAVLPVGR